MNVTLRKYNYRFAEQVLNSKLSIKDEYENIISNPTDDLSILSRPKFNEILKDKFSEKGWEVEPNVFDDSDAANAKMDFLKDRIGIEVGFGHPSFIGIDLLKFQVSSYSELNKIDVGVYVVTTSKFQKLMIEKYKQKWTGSLNYEKVIKYLPFFKSAIQVPVQVIGIDAST